MYLHTPAVERDSWYRVDTASGSNTPTTVYLHDGTDPIGTSWGASGSTVRQSTRDGGAYFWSATQVLYLKQLTYQGLPSGTVITSTGVAAPLPPVDPIASGSFAQKWLTAAVSTTLTGTLAAWTVAAVDCTAGQGARTLPAASSVLAGTELAAKKNDTTANTLVVGVTGSDVILGTGAGGSSKTLTLPGETATFVSDGVSKYIVRSSDTPVPQLDARYNGTYVQKVATPTGVAATDAAAIQAAHDALPSTGGRLILQAGTYALGTIGLTVSKPSSWVGAGGTDGTGAAITKLTYSGSTGDAITVSAAGCTFTDLYLLNISGTTPTAGTGFKVTHGNLSRWSRVEVDGFWNNFDIDDAYYYTISDSAILNPVNYGLYLKNATHKDNGDQGVINCVIAQYSVAARTGAAAVRWESGGGLRFVGNKINGGVQPSGVTAGFWPVGLDIAVADGVTTSDHLITGNSFEGCDGGTGLYIRNSGTGTGTLKNFVITGNQWASAGMKIEATNAGNIANASISGNVFYNMLSTQNSIYLKNADNIAVGMNSHKIAGSGSSLYIDTGCTNIAYGQQASPGSGFLVIDQTVAAGASPAATSSQQVFTREITGIASNSVYGVVWRLAVPTFSGGMLDMTFSGNAPGAGGYCVRLQRSWTRQSGAVTLGTIGTDVAAWPGANPVVDTQLDGSTGTIVISIKIDATGGASSITGRSTLKVDGPFTSLTRA